MGQVNTMNSSLLASVGFLCSACSAVTDPARTDNHQLVSSGGQSNDNAAISGPGNAGDPQPIKPLSMVTADDIQSPCLQYCSNYGACITHQPLDCASLCHAVVQQAADQRCIEPVYHALECLRARLCSDGLPDLSATPKASVAAGTDAAASNAANNCRLEALAVNCRIDTPALDAGTQPNPFELLASGAGINDCYLADEPSHDSTAIQVALKAGLTGFWRCLGSSHTYSVKCTNTGDRISCLCNVNGDAYAATELPLTWPQPGDMNYWQLPVEGCGWRY
jgi:hypothetical protein